MCVREREKDQTKKENTEISAPRRDGDHICGAIEVEIQAGKSVILGWDGRGVDRRGRDVVFGVFIRRWRSVPAHEPAPHISLPCLCGGPIPKALHHLTCRFKEKRWDSKQLIGSGGMPSSHSATVAALAVAIGFEEGTRGSSFALAVVLAAIVMYDASGIRLHAGRQAELLNQIVCEFPPEHPISSVRPLRELLGHTPLQVVMGAVLGCVVSYLLRSSV